jgi:hypothetical protein
MSHEYFIVKYLGKHLNNEYLIMRSRFSVVGIATGYGLEDRGVEVRVPVGAKNFLVFPYYPDRFWDPSSTYPMGTGGSFPGGKEAGS